MRNKLLAGSLLLNAVLAATIVAGAVKTGDVVTGFIDSAAERWRTQFDLATPQPGSIVFLGDSITEGAHWSELFGNCRILNRGIGGDTTQDLLDRIGQIYRVEPAKLFLMIGVNDLNTGVPQETTFANYRRLFDGFAARLPTTRVYVQSVLPVGGAWFGGATNPEIAQLNAFLAEESARRGYAFLDLAPAFGDAEGAMRVEYSNDGIHLLGAGYARLRDAIRDRVVE